LQYINLNSNGNTVSRFVALRFTARDAIWLCSSGASCGPNHLNLENLINYTNAHIIQYFVRKLFFQVFVFFADGRATSS
jgi:hypothetical protein